MGPIDFLRDQHQELTALRRDLHAHPELGFEEHRTAQVVTGELDKLGVEYHTGIGQHRGGRAWCAASARTAAARSGCAPTWMRCRCTRKTILPTSRASRAACTAAATTGIPPCSSARRATSPARAASTARVYLIFQPGEEGFGGGKAMVDDGLFERFPADAIYALHNWPALPPGKIGVRPGPMMAAADRIDIHIEGRGGHGAHPHLAVDPVLVAGHIITAAQSIVARNVSPVDTAVVSLCAMHAGNLAAMSVIPREARLVGTVRTFRPQTAEAIERRLNELVHSIAAAFGACGNAALRAAVSGDHQQRARGGTSPPTSPPP